MSSDDTSISDICSRVRSDYDRNRRIMSFSQYFDLVRSRPRRHLRSSSQYTRDCFSFWGTTEVEESSGESSTRYTLFDAPFDGGRDRMVGQERVQTRIFNLLDNFVRSGRMDKLVLLHGPNGSAKSTFIKTLMRALEAYSECDEGAIYKFNWIFPSESLAAGASIGFGSGATARAVDRADLETFAFLDDDLVDARLSGTLKDHPFLLVPQAERARLISELVERTQADEVDAGEQGAEFVLPEHLLHGDLSHTNRQIFDALLTSYQGELSKVLKHIQVERVYLSRRYRSGLVTVEPQMRVDAGLRQLTADRSLGALPPVLQNTMLFSPVGDLVDANRGVIEYDDMFKRHPDLNKYLLSASERQTVALDDRILYLDLVMLATGNEMYLDAFKKTAEYASFKGRVELVRVPYLLDHLKERQIYDAQISTHDVGKFVAPHTTHVAALWSVLTRLRRPDTDAYSELLRDVVAGLTPLQKADLYAEGRVPDKLSQERARELRAHIGDMFDETAGSNHYEGRYGASPREMKMILLNAAARDAYPCLSPLAIFDELADLVRDTSVFPFLQMEADGDYNDHAAFIGVVRERYLDLIDLEIQDAMGLVDEEQYNDLFARYIDHVSQSIKGEKVYNSIAGVYEDPDTKFMEEVESTILVEDDTSPEVFRRDLISSIAAAFIDNPDESVDYRRVFPNLFALLRRSVYDERARVIQKTQQNMLEYFEGEAGSLEPADLEAVERTLANLMGTYGHNEASAREAVAFLMSSRYNE